MIFLVAAAVVLIVLSFTAGMTLIARLLKDAGQSSVDQPASLSSREGFESGDDRSARSSVKA